MKDLANVLKQRWVAVSASLFIVALVLVAVVTYKLWLPQARGYFERGPAPVADSHAGHDHGGHNDAHPGHVEE